MPCTADSICVAPADNPSPMVPNFTPDDAEHFANMGWVGFAKLTIDSLNTENVLRVNSADLNLAQDIEMPDVIDGRIDRTIYKLGPKTVEGTLSLPVVADVAPALLGDGCPTVQDLTVAGSLLDTIWCWATARTSQGRMMYNDARIDVRYANHAAFTFDRTVVNTLGLSVTQGDQIGWDINVYGRARQPAVLDIEQLKVDPAITDFLAPARVLTWNDISVNGIRGCNAGVEEDLFFSNQVREFNMDIANNTDRFYTLNGSLFPTDINVGQREISGSLTLMGLADRLRILAESNPERFTEKNEVRVAIYIGNETFNGANFDPRNWTGINSDQPSQDAIWYKKLTGVVFQIEEMSMTNDLFETTVNWHALANDQFGYTAFSPDSSSCLFPSWQ